RPSLRGTRFTKGRAECTTRARRTRRGSGAQGNLEVIRREGDSAKRLAVAIPAIEDPQIKLKRHRVERRSRARERERDNLIILNDARGRISEWSKNAFGSACAEMAVRVPGQRRWGDH